VKTPTKGILLPPDHHWRRLGPRSGGDEVGALAPNIFFAVPQNVTFGGTSGTHCVREFQYLIH